MKERYLCTGFWIDRGRVGALGVVAWKAGERVIRQGVRAALGSRSDVFDVKGVRADALRCLAVLAALFRAMLDFLAS